MRIYADQLRSIKIYVDICGSVQDQSWVDPTGPDYILLIIIGNFKVAFKTITHPVHKRHLEIVYVTRVEANHHGYQTSACFHGNQNGKPQNEAL